VPSRKRTAIGQESWLDRATATAVGDRVRSSTTSVRRRVLRRATFALKAAAERGGAMHANGAFPGEKCAIGAHRYVSLQRRRAVQSDPEDGCRAILESATADQRC